MVGKMMSLYPIWHTFSRCVVAPVLLHAMVLQSMLLRPSAVMRMPQLRPRTLLRPRAVMPRLSQLRLCARVLQRRPLRPSAVLLLRPCVCCAAVITQPWPLLCALAFCLGLPSLQRAVVVSVLAFCLAHRQDASGVWVRGRVSQSATAPSSLSLMMQALLTQAVLLR